MPEHWIDPRVWASPAREWTQDHLVDWLATQIGPVYASTASNGDTRSVYSEAMLGLLPEDGAFVGAELRVNLGTHHETRRIVVFTAASGLMIVDPPFSATVEIGAEWEIYGIMPVEVLIAALNRAIEDAAPDLYEQRQAKMMLHPEQTLYIVPQTADDVIGIEVEPIIPGYPYQRLTRDRYEVLRVDPVFYSTVEEACGLQVALSHPPHGQGQPARVHYKRYFRPLTSATATTRLDPGYLLPQAEMYARRALLAQERGSTLTRHHSELMIDARELAAARKVALAVSLSGVPPAGEKKKKK